MRLFCKIFLLPVIFLVVSAAAFGQSAADEFFSSVEYGFKIKLPKTPGFTEKKVNNLGEGAFYIWEDQGAQFLVQSMLFSSPVDDQFKAEFLLGFKNGLFQSSKATSITDKDYSFKGNKGSEFTLLYEKKGKTIARGFYVGMRFFAVTATFFLNQPGVKEADIVATLDSFDIVRSAPATDDKTKAR